MNENVFKGILVFLLGIAVICVLVSFKTKSKVIKRIMVVGTFLPTIVSILPYFSSVPFREVVVYYGKAEELEKMENSFARTLNKNAELESNLKEEKEENEKLNSRILDMEEELNTLRNSSKYIPNFIQARMYKDGNELIINQDTAVASINNTLYFSDDAVRAIANETVSRDETNNVIYLGKYPEKTVDLLTVSEPFDQSYYFNLGSESPFKIQGKIYSDGFKLRVDGTSLETVSFNLESKYSEMSFGIGHIDGTSKEGSFILTPYFDGVKGEPLVVDVNTSIETIQTIPLNHTRILKLEWSGDEGNNTGTYGLVNIKLK